jgi:hypothetical protein
MDSRELTEWMAYEQVTGPLGTERGDIHTALLATVVANSLKGKKGRRHKLRDFLPAWHKRRQSDDEMLAMAKTLNRMHGGRTITREED